MPLAAPPSPMRTLSSPSRIISAGRVDTLCFDKTGTLTEDGLSIQGLCPVVAHGRGGGGGRGEGAWDLKLGPLERRLIDHRSDVDVSSAADLRQMEPLRIAADTYLPMWLCATCQLQGVKEEEEMEAAEYTERVRRGFGTVMAGCHSLSLLEERGRSVKNKGEGPKAHVWRTFQKALTRLVGGKLLSGQLEDVERGGTVRGRDGAEEGGDGGPGQLIGDPLEVEMFEDIGKGGMGLASTTSGTRCHIETLVYRRRRNLCGYASEP